MEQYLLYTIGILLAVLGVVCGWLFSSILKRFEVQERREREYKDFYSKEIVQIRQDLAATQKALNDSRFEAMQERQRISDHLNGLLTDGLKSVYDQLRHLQKELHEEFRRTNSVVDKMQGQLSQWITNHENNE